MIALFAALAAFMAAAAAAAELRFDDREASPTYGSVEVVGLDAAELERLRALPEGGDGWTRHLALYVVEEERGGLADPPPVWGSHALEEDRLRFTPRFPPAPGQAYVARWRSPLAAPGTTPLELRFALPEPERRPTTTVAAVYPTADEVPANLLKLYVSFSAPMSRGRAHRHLRLTDARGEPVEAAFVAPEHELWNPAGDRLTLFFDPGRIKRGVGPNAERGPPLRPGETYRLAIDPAWPDASGAPLVRGFEKRFRAVAPDRVSPRSEDWRLRPPAAPGEPVVLDFPEPLDRALLERLVAVVDAAGERLAGEVEVAPGERRWSFRPARPWPPGRYELRVSTALEDLAGNSLRRPFETRLAGEPPPPGPVLVELSFEVAGSSR